MKQTVIKIKENEGFRFKQRKRKTETESKRDKERAGQRQMFRKITILIQDACGLLKTKS